MEQQFNQMKVKTSSSSQKGKRLNNEDTIVELLNLDGKDKNKPKVGIFIICDGHTNQGNGDGKKISEYVAGQLFENMTKKDMVYPINDADLESMYKNINKSLTEKYPTESVHAGTTALVILLYKLNKEIFIQTINLGDCRAIIYNDYFSIPLTVDHKPDSPKEMKRLAPLLESTGVSIEYSSVYTPRILGLSVTRVFGDLDCAEYTSQIPDSFVRKLDPKDEFVVLACDGLWDVMQNSDVGNFIANKYNSESKLNVSKQLVEYAINARESDDNVSVIIIKFSN